ncbi:ABC transporter substrate-binding protein [Sulfurimonas sp.]|uniref:ABC transporter substrate-binding protein n=1 Tax=Sulfurimonas sp. TaxID=2022749 RepID=UPI00356551B3
MKFFNNFIKILLLLSITNLYAHKLDKVSLQLQWKHQFEFAGFYAAKEKGFFKNVGLDVEFLEYDSAKSISQEVLEGRAEYGLSYSSIVAEYLEGKPLVLVANFFKQSPLVLIAQDNIESPKELKGKKIMGVSDSIDNITLLLMLDKFGLKTKDIINIPASFKIDEFINKKIDAMSAFTTNELYYLNKKGIKYTIFDPVVYGAKYYDVNLFTSKIEILQNPQRVQRFKEASIRGWEYALKHKEEIVEIILQKYNTQNKSKEALLFEAKQIEQLMLSNIYKVGSIDKDRVKIIADSFMQAGFVKKIKNRDIEAFIFDSSAFSISFSQKEKEYLEKKKEITMCVDPNWMPFEALVNGEYKGLNSEFLKLFQKELPIPIKVIKTDSWSESIKLAKEKKCDVLSLFMQTKEREKYFNFPTPYLDVPPVIVTKTDKASVIDIHTIGKEKIAVVKDYALVDIIKKKYKNLEVVEVKNTQDGLRKVEDGEVFGFAGSSVAIEYNFQHGEYSSFKISAHFDEKLSFGFGVREDDIYLYNILQKLVQKLSEEDKHDILKKYFTIKYEQKFDYFLFYQLFATMFIIAIIFFYRSRKIKKLNEALQEKMEAELKKSSDKDKMLFHQNKLSAMGEMLENIAHQWRQPLSQINSSVLLIDDILHEKNFRNIDVEERLLEIESLTKYLSNTINDFKDFFAHNKKRNNFLLREMIEKSIYIVKGSLKENNIEVSVEIEQDYRYYGYESELQQVVLVLLNNAKEALVNRSIKTPIINIYIELEDEFYIIKICDNAGGITKNIREKIFEPYFTTKHKSKGTGLGLYMSKKIIEESMDGELNVNNQNKGVCFEIKLKVVDE